jgi:outer membrane protein assembly factor BamE (lipoprotein component of BamABCDE complex)
MSRRIRVTLGVGAAAIAVGAAACFIQVRDPDGLAGWIWCHLYPDTAVYASGYTESAFRKIHRGMTEDEVSALLGKPIDRVRRKGDKWLWEYSVSPTNRSYRLRSVLFANGRVEDVFHEFYVD